MSGEEEEVDRRLRTRERVREGVPDARPLHERRHEDHDDRVEGPPLDLVEHPHEEVRPQVLLPREDERPLIDVGVAVTLGEPPLIAAALGVLATMLLTGGMHEALALQFRALDRPELIRFLGRGDNSRGAREHAGDARPNSHPGVRGIVGVIERAAAD